MVKRTASWLLAALKMARPHTLQSWRRAGALVSLPFHEPEEIVAPVHLLTSRFLVFGTRWFSRAGPPFLLSPAKMGASGSKVRRLTARRPRCADRFAWPGHGWAVRSKPHQNESNQLAPPSSPWPCRGLPDRARLTFPRCWGAARTRRRLWSTLHVVISLRSPRRCHEHLFRASCLLQPRRVRVFSQTLFDRRWRTTRSDVKRTKSTQKKPWQGHRPSRRTGHTRRTLVLCGTFATCSPGTPDARVPVRWCASLPRPRRASQQRYGNDALRWAAALQPSGAPSQFFEPGTALSSALCLCGIRSDQTLDMEETKINVGFGRF